MLQPNFVSEGRHVNVNNIFRLLGTSYSLFQAVGAERKRYGFVLERHCALVKHQVNWHGKANTLLQIKLAEWLALCRAYQVRKEDLDYKLSSFRFFCPTVRSSVHPSVSPSITCFSNIIEMKNFIWTHRCSAQTLVKGSNGN